jgi:seryl-tRNA synthetase
MTKDIEKKEIEELKANIEELKEIIKEFEIEEKNKIRKRDKLLSKIGNIVHESCIISKNKECRGVIKETKNNNEISKEESTKIINKEKSEISGSYTTYLENELFMLNMKIKNESINFLKKEFEYMIVPNFISKNMYDLLNFENQNQIIKINYHYEDKQIKEKYFTDRLSTNLLNYYIKTTFQENELPKKTFTSGTILYQKNQKIKQNEQTECVILSSPNENKSWEEMNKMVELAEEYFKTYNIEYKVVNEITGELKLEEAKKIRIDGWLEKSEKYINLFEISNCTDFETKLLKIKNNINTKKVTIFYQFKKRYMI